MRHLLHHTKQPCVHFSFGYEAATSTFYIVEPRWIPMSMQPTRIRISLASIAIMCRRTFVWKNLGREVHSPMPHGSLFLHRALCIKQTHFQYIDLRHALQNGARADRDEMNGKHPPRTCTQIRKDPSSLDVCIFLGAAGLCLSLEGAVERTN